MESLAEALLVAILVGLGVGLLMALPILLGGGSSYRGRIIRSRWGKHRTYKSRISVSDSSLIGRKDTGADFYRGRVEAALGRAPDRYGGYYYQSGYISGRAYYGRK